MKDQRIQLLSEAPIPQAVNKMATPAIIGLLVMAIYNLVDTMFVAWIGPAATGATQVVLPVMMISSAIGLSFGIGGGSYLSRLIGQKNWERAKTLNSVVFFSGLLLGLLLVLLMLFNLQNLLRFFGASEELMPLSLLYGRPIVIGSFFMIGSMVLNNLLRSEGSGKYSMIGMAAGSILNLILDPIFIFAFKWGITGAAVATAISQCISFLILLSMYLRNKALVPIKWKNFKPDISLYGEVLKIGMPTFAKQALVGLSVALINQVAVKTGGTNLIAAMGLVMRVTMIPFNIIFGLGQGLQPVAGYNIGAKREDRVRQALLYSLVISGIIMAITSLLYILIPNTILSIFKSPEEVLSIARLSLAFNAVGMIFFGVGNTVAVYFQARGKGLISFILSISRQGIFFLPLLFILPSRFGLKGVLAIQSSADILSFSLSLCFLIPALISLKKLIKKDEKSSIEDSEEEPEYA